MPRYTKFYSQAKVGTKMANGKLSSRQRTKLSSMWQRHAATAVKRARYMALLPYEGDNR